MVTNVHILENKSRNSTNHDAVANRPDNEIPEQEADGATIPQSVRSAQEQTSSDNS